MITVRHITLQWRHMSAMATQISFQITGNFIFLQLARQQRKRQSSALLIFCEENQAVADGFPWQMTSTEEIFLYHDLIRDMMTSSNGNIFRITGLLCGEFTGQRWIPRTKASDAELWCFVRLNKPWSKQSWGWWFETPKHPLWRHCNESRFPFKQVFSMEYPDDCQNKMCCLLWDGEELTWYKNIQWAVGEPHKYFLFRLICLGWITSYMHVLHSIMRMIQRTIKKSNYPWWQGSWGHMGPN